MRSQVNADGLVRQTAGTATTDATFTRQDVESPDKLARAIQNLQRAVSLLTRNAPAEAVDFEDVAVAASGGVVRLRHGLRGRVRWYVVGWSTSGTSAPVLKLSADTTEDELVLLSYVAGTASIRVEAAG